jgi:hypothetical protein
MHKPGAIKLFKDNAWSFISLLLSPYFLLLASYMLLFTIPIASATSTGGVTIEPAFQEVVIKPQDKSKEFEFKLTNHTSTNQTFNLGVVDFGTLDETGGVAFIGLTDPVTDYKYGLASWMKLSEDRVSVEPEQTESIIVTIDNRESLSPGGHYGAILVRPDSPEDQVGGDQVGISQVASALVFVKKTGGEIYQLQLKSVKNKHSLFSIDQKVGIEFLNTGNVHLVPRGIAQIKDPKGRVISERIINNESGVILPESVRQYNLNLVKQANSWLPGKYQLIVQYRFDGNSAFLTTTTDFIYLGKAAKPLILLIITSVLMVYIFRKQITSRLIAKRKKTK